MATAVSAPQNYSFPYRFTETLSLNTDASWVVYLLMRRLHLCSVRLPGIHCRGIRSFDVVHKRHIRFDDLCPTGVIKLLLGLDIC